MLWATFILAFYGFLRASKFATAALIWQHIYLESDRYTMFIEHSKTDPFCCCHTITIYAICTSTCPVRVLRLCMETSISSQANSPVFKSGRFSPLDRQHLTIPVPHLLQNTHYNHQNYASHSFRSSAVNAAAAAAGIPDLLITFLGRRRSNGYQGYIHSFPVMLHSIPALLAHTDTPYMDISTTN